MVRRLQMTTADYLAIAVTPALIMALVGSLVFFLLEVFYQGQFHGRLQYIMALFVFAAVLIGRISIVEGASLASIYGLALAAVTLLAINRFIDYNTSFTWLINTSMIASIWWCAHKLTWDCTLFDESEDDASRGLLQTIGIGQPQTADSSEPEKHEPELEEPEGTTAPDAPLLTWRERLAEERRRPHTPGVWVLYFSLAALPIFGFAGRFIPAGDIASRQSAFNFLCVYVASGLGLLLMTSFLGLRRYLRGRRLQMPAEMAGTWLVVGCLIIGALLLFAALIPRPQAEYAISKLPFRITSPTDLGASRYATGSDGTEDPESESRSQVERADAETQSDETTSSDRDGEKSGGEQSEGEQGEGEKSGGEQSEGEQSEGDQSEEEQSGGDQSEGESPRDDGSEGSNDSQSDADEGESSDDSSGESQSEDSQSAAQDNQSSSPPPTQFHPQMSLAPTTSVIAAILKTVFYIVIAVVALVLLWRYRREVLAAVRRFLDEIREFWARLFGRKRDDADGEDEPAGAAGPGHRPFADFTDPFATGRADSLPPQELVRYSFAAFEAWAREKGHSRLPDQTPHELARNVSAGQRALSDDARRVARLYSQVAYAPDHLPQTDVDDLRQLWWQMSR